MNDEPKQTEAEELYESWVNGNRTHVVDRVLRMTKVKAVKVAAQLTGFMDEADRGVFQRLIEARRGMAL